MITPRTRPALATSQVSEVQQPQVCVHWTVQGVIPERNKGTLHALHVLLWRCMWCHILCACCKSSWEVTSSVRH